MLKLIYDFLIVAFFSIFIFVLYKLWKYLYSIVRLPPGPTGLPFLGVVNKLDPLQVRQTLQQWKDQYGDIYSFTLPGQQIVVVSSYDLIKEVLLTRADVFAGRPQSFRANALTDFIPTLGFASDSPKMRLLKKTLSTSMKMYGERLLRLEELSLGSIKEMVGYWKSFEGKPFDPQQSIHDTVGKIITSLAWGKEMTKEQFEEILHIQQISTDVLTPGGFGQLLEVLPCLRHFGNQTWKTLMEVKKRFDTLIGKLYGECKARFDGKNPECVVHSVLVAKEKVNQEHGGKEVISDIDVLYLGWTLVGAGISTTFRATYSFIAILINNPALQKRLQQEVDEAVGDETPRLVDKEKMPYLEATMYELLRYISHVPILLPHATMEDTKLGGYAIPKDAQVWVNAFGLHHDPRYWDEPWEFKPERFLDENGDCVKPDHINRRRLLPFGAGRLVCAGEVLAKNRMFLILSGIVQNFTFKPKSEAEKPDHDPRNYISGFVTNPKDYEVRAIPRKV